MKTSQTCTPLESCPGVVLFRFISNFYIDTDYLDVNITYQTKRNTMKITAVIARLLLGFIFLVFGLNGFLHFIPSSPPSGTPGPFLAPLFLSPYLVPLFPLHLISSLPL